MFRVPYNTGNTISGNQSFQKTNSSITQSSFIKQQETKGTFNCPRLCSNNKYLNYEYLYKNKASTYLNYYSTKDNALSLKYSLPSGLNTNLNLEFEFIKPIYNLDPNETLTRINATSITKPFLQYNIDKKGDLFGNTFCGLNNYLNYREPN